MKTTHLWPHLIRPALVLACALGGCKPGAETPASHASEPPGATRPSPAEAEAGVPVDSVTLPVRTERVEARPVAVESSALATITPLPGRTAELGFKIGGRIASLTVGEGEHVRPGQVLGTLVDQAVAQTQLALAEANAVRDRQLFEKGILARRAMEASALQAEQARQALSGTRMTAPFAGTVVKRMHAVGEYVDPATPVLGLVDLAVVDAVASVYETDLSRFQEGQPVTVTTPAAPDRRFAGRVALVSDVLDPASRTFQVKVRVPNPGRALKIGMSARVIVKRGVRRALAVPAAALLDAPAGGKQVFVREGDRYEARPLTIGQVSGPWAEVKAGLAPGELVVTQGQFELQASLNKGAAPTDDD